jgi:MraZ protein
MVVFSGEHGHTLDPKGRVVIPLVYRNALAEGVFLTRGMDECLWLFPSATWRTISSRLRQMRTFAARSRLRDRRLFAGTDTEMDAQGRLALPSTLRAHAGLVESGPVVVVGVNNRLELWNPERWAEHVQGNREELEKAMEEADL